MQLCEWAESETVQFVFSGAHLMEMAPLEPQYTPAAALRADLLVALCRRNAVISHDKLVALELESLQHNSAPSIEAITTTATWFPDLTDVISPVRWVDAMKDVDVMSKEHGLNRSQRRQLKRTMFKAGKPTKATRQFMADNEAGSDYRELLEQFPMREEDAKVFGQYVIGKTTADQATEALLESLRDPRWMMKWFANNHTRMTPFIAWLRKPADLSS